MFEIQKQPPKVLRLSVCHKIKKKNIPSRRAIGVNESVHQSLRGLFSSVLLLLLFFFMLYGYSYVDLLTSGQRETKIKTARENIAGLRKTIPSIGNQSSPRRSETVCWVYDFQPNQKVRPGSHHRKYCEMHCRAPSGGRQTISYFAKPRRRCAFFLLSHASSHGSSKGAR